MTSLIKPLREGIDLWYVQSPDIEGIDPIAIKPEVIFENSISKLQWHNTTQLKSIQIKDIKLDKETSCVKVQGMAHLYLFMPLTLDLYHEKIKQNVVGNPTFETFEALRNYYLKTNFYHF